MWLLCVLLGAVLSRLGLPRIAAYVSVGVAFSPDFLGAWSDLATARVTRPLAARCSTCGGGRSNFGD